jgi:RHS repeat-associated protein
VKLNVNTWEQTDGPTSGTSSNNRLANTKERDASIGLDNHGFRYYDPEIGRYTTRDPIGYGDGMNVYLSVHNNPINHFDPLGLNEHTEEEIDERPPVDIEGMLAFQKHLRLQRKREDFYKRVGEYNDKHEAWRTGIETAQTIFGGADKIKDAAGKFKLRGTEGRAGGILDIVIMTGQAATEVVAQYQEGRELSDLHDMCDQARAVDLEPRMLMEHGEGWNEEGRSNTWMRTATTFIPMEYTDARIRAANHAIDGVEWYIGYRQKEHDSIHWVDDVRLNVKAPMRVEIHRVKQKVKWLKQQRDKLVKEARAQADQ